MSIARIPVRLGLSRRRCGPAVLLAGASLMTGCSALPLNHDAEPANAGTAHSGDPVGAVFKQESQRDRLNDGYSALYKELRGLSQTDKILYAKVESDPVQHVVEDLTQYAGQLKTRLDSLAQQFPALDLNRTVVPPIVSQSKNAQLKGTAEMFAPVVGLSGARFERGLLIRLLGAADQQRYLTQTLARQEPVKALSDIMLHASDEFAKQYDEINSLLQKSYYK